MPRRLKGEVVERPSRYIGPVRKNKTRLQEQGLYTLAQLRLIELVPDASSKNALALRLGYKSAAIVRWLCNGSIPAPPLNVAVILEKEYGIRCVEWYEPAVRVRAPE